MTLRTADGLALGAWFVPAGAPERGMAVLVASGNAGNRSLRAPLAAALARRGLAVLLFDYRGYGGNRGRPTEAGAGPRCPRRAAVPARRGRPAARPASVLRRESRLGRGQHPPAGLVLRSPFIDLASVGRVHYPFLPVRALILDRYPLAERLARMTVPTSIVYSSEDRIVPPDQSRAVAAAARGAMPVVEVEGADHNDGALLDGAALIAAVVELAERCAAAR